MRLLIEGLRERKIFCHAALDSRGEAASRLDGTAKVFSLSMSGGLDLSAAIKIAKYCKTHKIQIIDAQTSNAHSIALMVKIFCPNVKLVVHRRVDYLPKKGWINRKKYFSPKVNRFVAISNTIGEILVNYGLDENIISVVPSAVDSKVYQDLNHIQEKSELVKGLGIDPTLKLIGNASAMTSQKGYETLLESLKILVDKGERFHCVIAGDGPLRDKLESMRMSLGIDKQVSFLGWIKEVPQFLTALDILAMPSNFEGLGTLILDGIHAGCCVVASNAGGIPEMIIHDKTGLISNVGDATVLAANLSRALASEELCQNLNSAAKIHIQQKFSLQSMVEGNQKIYESLLES